MQFRFRIKGKDCRQVAQELTNEMDVRFRVKFTAKDVQPPQSSGGTEADKVGLAEALLALEAVYLAWEAYNEFIREPAEKRRQELVNHWTEIVLFAKRKLPTTIRLHVNDQALYVHESAPERLHEVTEQAIRVAVEKQHGA